MGEWDSGIVRVSGHLVASADVCDSKHGVSSGHHHGGQIKLAAGRSTQIYFVCL